MNIQDTIQNSLDYIEDNLKAEITAQELAERANFSLFHYYRIFQTAVGMPVMQYIGRRKLLHAIHEMGCGRKNTDVALEYGFGTYAGFYKAFLREFGYTPKQFLKMYKLNKPYRIHLIKEDCNLITHKKISQILKNWNLEKEEIKDIFYDNGERNIQAFYVGNDYVMKIFTNLETLKKHTDISNALKNCGLSATPPIKTMEDREFVEDGPLYFVLTKRLQGQRIKAVDIYNDDYKEKARFVGEILGQLSLTLSKVDILVPEKNLYETVVNWALPKVKEMTGMSEKLFNSLSEDFYNMYNSLPRQIIHRDPNPSNIIVSEENWGFIDFELSEKNVRIYDPCYAATAILSESFNKNDEIKLSKWIEIYKNIIYGYDSVAKLSVEEWHAVPYVILCNQLICCAWFSEQEKYQNIFHTNLEITKWICAKFDDLTITE